MNRKQKQKQKQALGIRKETIRKLNVRQLNEVLGGGGNGVQQQCDTTSWTTDPK